MLNIRPRNARGSRPELGRESQGNRPSETHLKQLMTGGARGDAKSYDALLRAVTPLLTSFYGRRLRDGAADVEDLIQETLIALHNRRGSYDQARPFTPWLFAIARHKLIDHFRRSRVHHPIDELSNILRVEGFEDVSNARLDTDRLLDRLPNKQSQAIRHTRLKGLSVAEAAKAMGIGESDVKVSVHRGIKALAGHLSVKAA